MTLQQNMFDGITVDNFAGGGGASTGIKNALGRDVDIAINHDPAAIAMHRANHPYTQHFCESVWEIDPRKVAQGRPVSLAWFSPDCTHFSKAKGAKPVKKSIRGLSWVVLRWAMEVRPRVIMLENVEEIKTWGPLTAVNDGFLPDPERKGETFQGFIQMLSTGISVNHPAFLEACDFLEIDPSSKNAKMLINGLGYDVDYRELRACDYGAPTSRKRFFMVARCDGRPIVWPAVTHGDPKSAAVMSGRLKPYRTAAEIIDWSIPCPSIFERKKPLAENTMRRIARGIQKFVIDNPEPFIMQAYGGGYTGAGSSINRPLPTVTAKDHNYLVPPTLIQTGYGERQGQVPRVPGLGKPLGTAVAGGQKHALVAAFLSQYHSYDDSARGQALDRPLLTLDTSNRYSLVTSHLIKMKGTNIGQPVTEPLQTITAGGNHFGEVRAFLTTYYGTGIGSKVNEPLPTVVSKDRFGLVVVNGLNYHIVDIGMRMLQPRELFNAQGFPADYIIDKDSDGKAYPKSAQVARCGNAVPPIFAEILVRANLPEMCKKAA